DEYLAEKNSSNVIEYTNWNGDRAQWILEPVSSSRSAIEKIQTEDTSPEFVVYPNPSVNGEFTIELKGMKSSEISIYNILGALVYSTKTSDNKILVATDKLFESGLYLIQVIDETSHIYTEKLIIR
ncbi:MAG: T9SS type A sorting domain-containing protein, partial [Leeuwenhoekiella sp.]